MKRALACGLFLVAMPAFSADELGRLFFTPEQRAMLDLARRTQPQSSQGTEASFEGVTLSGIVTRNDGRRTVWVNGQPQAIAPGGSSTSAVIPLPSGEGRIRLKVGQTLDTASGAVQEGYRRVPKEEPAASANVPAPAKTDSRLPVARGDDGSPDDASDGAAR